MTKNVKRWEMDSKTKREFEIFKKSGETSMFFLFVINDPTLPDSAKILFHKIYGWAARTGYCDSSDHYLSEEANLSESSVKSGLNALKKKGWLRKEMVPTSTGSKRRISILYHALRKDCPKPDKYQGHNIGEFRGFAKNRKNYFHPNAIATYVICKKYKQTFMSIKPPLHDKRLKTRSRILFQIISSLSVLKGYCFAQNTFLRKKMNVNEGTISTHLTLLENEGLIRMTYGGKRRVYLEFDKLRKRYLKKEDK